MQILKFVEICSAVFELFPFKRTDKQSFSYFNSSPELCIREHNFYNYIRSFSSLLFFISVRLGRGRWGKIICIEETRVIDGSRSVASAWRNLILHKTVLNSGVNKYNHYLYLLFNYLRAFSSTNLYLINYPGENNLSSNSTFGSQLTAIIKRFIYTALRRTNPFFVFASFILLKSYRELFTPLNYQVRRRKIMTTF